MKSAPLRPGWRGRLISPSKPPPTQTRGEDPPFSVFSGKARLLFVSFFAHHFEVRQELPAFGHFGHRSPLF